MNRITAVLLAGGRSSRMGSDKAFLEVDGVPAWQRQLAKLHALTPSEILISARSSQVFPDNTPATVVFDEVPDAGPFGGLITALRRAKESRVLVLGIDMLDMPSGFLQGLCRSTFLDSGLVYRNASYYEPLAAVYPCSLLPLAEERLEQGHLSLQGLIEVAVADGAIQPLSLPAASRRFFSNMNTIEELARVSAELSGEESNFSGRAGAADDSSSLSDRDQPSASLSMVRWEEPGDEAPTASEVEDHVATEAPLEIRVEGKSVAVVMRTPGHDEELATGFLISEGVIAQPEDIFEVSPCKSEEGAQNGNVIDVLLRRPDPEALRKLTRHVFSSSSCGICGKATLDSIFVDFPRVTQPLAFDVATLLQLPVRQREAQTTFERTGGLHASAVFDRFGDLILLREDVGRHNALDKILGAGFLEQRLPFNDHILLVSGRISFELMQKSLAAGFPLVAGVSAPSSLAVDFARESGQTLCGFLRGGRVNVYANPERISGA